MNTAERDNKLAAEEARREVQHRDIKSRVERDVNAELAARLDHTPPADSPKLEQVAGEFRGKAIDAVVQSDREVERARGMARLSQVVDYLFWVIYALLGMRLFLGLLAARSGAGFVQFVRAVTDPLYAPFRGIFPSPTAEGGYTLALPIVMAILVYAILHAGVNAFLRLLVHRKTAL
jgi:uncharacterized protein YggT (Ycf19 family)